MTPSPLCTLENDDNNCGRHLSQPRYFCSWPPEHLMLEKEICPYIYLSQSHDLSQFPYKWVLTHPFWEEHKHSVTACSSSPTGIKLAIVGAHLSSIVGASELARWNTIDLWVYVAYHYTVDTSATNLSVAIGCNRSLVCLQLYGPNGSITSIPTSC